MGSQINDTKGSKVSDFARKHMEKMGWKDGEGLGKEKQGLKSHIKVVKKLESSGLGLDESTKVLQSQTEHWWHDDFSNHLKQFKIGNKSIDSISKSKSNKKKKNKRKLDETLSSTTYDDDDKVNDLETDDKNSSSKKSKKKSKVTTDLPSSGPPSYEELFKATGGARLGMRARAKQDGKHKRTE